MHQLHLAEAVLNLGGYILVAVVLSLLVYRYARYSRWWGTDAGRAFMILCLCLGALVIYAFLALIFPDGEWRPIVRPLVIYSIGFALVYLVRVMVAAQGGWRRRNRP